MIVDFTVKTEHIVAGKPRKTKSPIALALKGLGYRNVKEYRSGFTLKDINGQEWEAKHTQKTMHFSTVFEWGLVVQPTRFRLRFIPE